MRKHGLRAGTALLVFVSTTISAAAQSAVGQTQAAETGTAEDPQAAIGDIIVTAQKRSESINKVGMSITAVGGNDLALKKIDGPADLVRIVPGFNFTPSAYGTPVLTLRGIGFYDTALGAAPTVSVYLDQIPLPLSSMSPGVSLDLERIEV